MFIEILQKAFGSHNDRFLKKLKGTVAQINGYESEFAGLSAAELAGKTTEFRGRLERGASLDDLLPEAFAVVREAAKRTLGQRHYDVQLLGGMILHMGNIAEMATGEGKTLVATLPTYLNALTGKGVHVVTVNDYLAKRDASWMGQIYRYLGLTVGCILNNMSDDERREAYACDITYATNNELGFDYLRDNMKFRLDEVVQRKFYYAIVDEVDSILIDEARTPLIISGPTEDSSDLYKAVNDVIPLLKPEDYEKDEKASSITFTEVGAQKVETIIEQRGLLKGGSLYDIQNIALVHHLNQALRAHHLFQRDVAYVVKENKVIIVDEFTGRMMEGRRFSDGLHQALEAKEGVEIQMENQTLASITFQNYFRQYEKLAGMTGTAKTEAPEFADIYNLDVIQVPTNVPIQRKDMDDEVYRTEAEKNRAIIKLIQECRDRQQPVLVGTVSIEKSEHLAELLKKEKIPHQVLNARYHEQEALIISQAGSLGAVTIATNMAGRGTDIKLGGNVEMRVNLECASITDEAERTACIDRIKAEVQAAEKLVKEAGGLFVIGTERHESRRIDNQLRGRSGRQGDPGASKFFLSLQDDLMRIFGSERLDSMLQRLGMQENEAIIHPWVNKALEKAQKRVEARNFEIRKHLLKYDNVMNDQRKVIYGQRRELMESDDAGEIVSAMREEVLEDLIARTIPKNTYADQWNIQGLHEEVRRLFALDLPIQSWSQEEGIAEHELFQRIEKAVQDHTQAKLDKYSPEMMRIVEKSILLRVLDQSWKDHLLALDHLRQGIGLRGYAQRDPLNEYKQEAFNLFHEMLQRVRETTISLVSYMEMGDMDAEDVEDVAFQDEGPSADLQYSGPSLESLNQLEDGDAPKTKASDSIRKRLGNRKKAGDMLSSDEPISRNAPCPCGSGKRYKHCHGKLEG